MAHDIATVNGRHSIAYFGDVPWHRLGTRLDQPATAGEAIVAAGLNYEVTLQSLWTSNGDPVSTRQAVVRRDTSDILGVVGKGYQPIQNLECFSFLDSVVADGRLRYHTAGALGKGERIWMLAKLLAIFAFAALRTSLRNISCCRIAMMGPRLYESSSPPFASSVPIPSRWPSEEADREGVSIAHKGDLGAKVKEAQEVLGFANRFYEHLETQIDQLVAYHPTHAPAARLF